MSDLVSESMDTKVESRQNSTPSTHGSNGNGLVSTRSYPARPAPTPGPTTDRPSHSANDTSTPHSGSSVLSPNNMGEKSMDILTTNDQGQSQYIGM